MALGLAYGIGVPVVKTLEWFGQWPRAMGGMAHRAMGDFGDYRPAGHDVMACSYFKSGTHWLMQIALQISWRGEASFSHIHDLIPWPDGPRRNWAAVTLGDDAPWRDSPTGLRVIKTHLPLQRTPYDMAARYIAVVRDPKDVCVSGYHFIQDGLLGPMMPTVDHWVDFFLSPEFFLGTWWAHLDSYWRARDRDNVLFLTYEVMKVDPAGTVRRIADLMSVDLNSQELARVVEQSSFSAMKRIEHRISPPMRAPWAKGTTAVRKGEKGGSHELLTPAQQSRIDDVCRAELKRLGSDFDYDGAFSPG